MSNREKFRLGRALLVATQNLDPGNLAHGWPFADFEHSVFNGGSV